LEAFSIEHFKFWRLSRCYLVQCYLLRFSDSGRRNDDRADAIGRALKPAQTSRTGFT
jgi:hypothetical protein